MIASVTVAARIPAGRRLGSLATPSIALVCTVLLMILAVRASPATLPLIAVGFLVFTPLERIRPRRAQRFASPDTAVNLAHATVSTALTVGLMASAMGCIALVPTVLVTQHWIASLCPAAALAVVVLAGDTGYYWTHRAAHRVPVLWRFHRIHHSSEELNWLAAARAHPVDQLVLHMGWILPLHVLGAGAPWFGVYAVFLTVEPLLAHSNINIAIRPIGWLLVTPAFHHWHHTAEPDARNKNFASQLSFLDALFGTWWLPRNREVERYGIDEPTATTYLGQLAAPFDPTATGMGPSAPTHATGGMPLAASPSTQRGVTEGPVYFG